ncbi:MAG: hypothetical protein FWC68_02015, partial [Oscillospiraceae bacterium]|nr:hypothetical protein [Oscillospiraceae bacterium]
MANKTNMDIFIECVEVLKPIVKSFDHIELEDENEKFLTLGELQIEGIEEVTQDTRFNESFPFGRILYALRQFTIELETGATTIDKSNSEYVKKYKKLAEVPGLVKTSEMEQWLANKEQMPKDENSIRRMVCGTTSKNIIPKEKFSQEGYVLDRLFGETHSSDKPKKIQPPESLKQIRITMEDANK